MNENWTPKNPPELSDSDAELLSAYIDNMLDAQEKAALEARLATDAFLRSELAAMRQMLGWIKTMPRLKAPRNFTISEADITPAAPKIVPMPGRSYNWQFASAAAVFVLILGGVLLYSQMSLKEAQAPANDIVANPTTEAPAAVVAFGSATPIFLPTVGFSPPAQDNANAGGAPQEEAESDEPDDAVRSSESSIAMGSQLESTVASAELAPQGGSGSGGDVSDENSEDFAGGAADGQEADIHMRTTATSETAPLAIASATAQALASPTPQPTMNAQAETRNFEPTMVAATEAPQSTEMAYTGEAYYATPTEESVAEESMTMMLAESTEATVEIEAEAPVAATGNDVDDATVQEMAITVMSLDVPGRIHAARQRVLQRIIGRE